MFKWRERPAERPLRVGQWIAQNIFTQSGAGADAAERPEDRGDFEIQNSPDCDLALSGRRSSAPSRSTASLQCRFLLNFLLFVQLRKDDRNGGTTI